MRCRICKSKNHEAKTYFHECDNPAGPICNECAEFREILLDFQKSARLNDGAMLRLFHEVSAVLHDGEIKAFAAGRSVA
jgi:hypothetical protein